MTDPKMPEPHGWVTMWPAMGGGRKPVYNPGAEKPSYGDELDALLNVYPVYKAAAAQAYAEALAAARVAQERERCAQVCEEEICPCCFDEDAQAVAEHLADAIRTQRLAERPDRAQRSNMGTNNDARPGGSDSSAVLGACPACGATAGLHYTFSGSCGFVECPECGATGPLADEAADPICDVDAALQAWNGRTINGGGCPWCGCLRNLHREGERGERMHCGDCDACWPVAPNVAGKAHGAAKP